MEPNCPDLAVSLCVCLSTVKVSGVKFADIQHKFICYASRPLFMAKLYFIFGYVVSCFFFFYLVTSLFYTYWIPGIFFVVADEL